VVIYVIGCYSLNIYSVFEQKNMIKTYNFIKVPLEDFDLLMQEIIWDNSRPLAKNIENAMWNIEYISEPWVVFFFEAGCPMQARIFTDKETAKSYVEENNQNGSLSCIKAEFHT